MQYRLGPLVWTALLLSWVSPAGATSFTHTLAEFTGSPAAPGSSFPLSAAEVGTFSILLPSGQDIVSATLSGRFGNASAVTSAPVQLLAEGIAVAECLEGLACSVFGASGSQDWSFTFDAGDFDVFADGLLTLSFVQTSFLQVQLGETTLTIQTVPEPATWLLFACGALALSLRRVRG